jgi:mannose-6-phosphate isomerase-like protein (cupin superfamily)
MKVEPGRVLMPAAEGLRVDLAGLGVVYKIRGHQTGGLLAIVEHPIAPRTLVVPHIHGDTDEYSYVIEGNVGARIGDEEVTAGPGDHIFKPRRVPHAFWNPTDKPARILEIIVPAGFEDLFEAGAAIFSSARSPEDLGQRLGTLAASYGNQLVFDWVPELSQRHGVRL